MPDDTRSARIAEFVQYVRAHMKGDEKGEAQIFLDRLFRAYGRGGAREVGAVLEDRIRNDTGGTSFADLVWKPHVLIEMKKRGEDLSRHLAQAFDYWVRLVPGRPRYVVLSNFDEFRIYDFDKDINEPQDTVTLDDLPAHYEALAFLFPTNEKPRFRIDREKVTREAADHLAAVYKRIHKRADVGPAKAQRFVLQCLICLFSEDIGLLPRHFFTQLLDECIDPPKAFDLLDGLFRAMNAPAGTTGGRFKGVPYFNGGIFSESAAVELDPQHEIAILKSAASYNWSHISPDIFGTIFQHSMEKEQRHAFGAHYTSQADIMKIVGPTIVQPWRTAIAEARSLEKLRALQQRLYTLRVLDPACGSGNFLYIAYRELKRIEKELLGRIREIAPKKDRGQREFGFVTSRQFYGMDILPFAVELAKVTMTLAHKLSIDELHIEEKALPLDNLDSNIIRTDALISGFSPASSSSSPSTQSSGAGVPPASTSSTSSPPPTRTPWPPADIIIGNPPFLGAKRLKPEHGSDYVNAVRKLYPEVPGMADYCVYWFRRAQDHLKPCTKEDPFTGRAGLVGTQNIRNNQSRVGGLDHIAQSGVIIEAVDNQPWSGEANVHVSIANWVKTSSPAPASSSVSASPSGQAEGLNVSSRGSPRSGTPGKSAPNTPDPEGVVVPSATTNEPSLLIPSPRKLWTKADATLPLLGPPDPARAKVTTKGKRGRTRADKSYELAFRECNEINSALSDGVDASSAKVLRYADHTDYCYTGQYPRHEGFMVTIAEAKRFFEADKQNREVVHPFLVGRELLSERIACDRFVIDFQTRTMLQAKAFTQPFAHLTKVVLPYVTAKAEVERKKTGEDTGQDQTWLKSWWLHFRPRPELVEKIAHMKRYVACSRVTKRPVFVFLSPKIRPGDALSCFVFSDDYSFAILQSDAHWQWFIAKCSKLKSDFRYTPGSVFDTFPWPQSPTKKQVRAVAEAGREIRRIRAEVLSTIKGGLRALYRTLELPGKNPLKDAHAALDAATLDAYGFSPKKDLLKQLLDLNLAVASRIDKSEAVTAPGVPAIYGDPADLITQDCIQP